MKTSSVLAVAVALASTAAVAAEAPAFVPGQLPAFTPGPVPTFNGAVPPRFTSPLMERSRAMMEKQQERMEKLNKEMAGLAHLPPYAQQAKMHQVMAESLRDHWTLAATVMSPRTQLEEQFAREERMNELRRFSMQQVGLHQAAPWGYPVAGNRAEAAKQADAGYDALEANRKAWQQAQLKAFDQMDAQMKAAIEQQTKVWQQVEAARMKAVKEMIEQQQAALRKAAEAVAKPAV